jgi:hypothetical protein
VIRKFDKDGKVVKFGNPRLTIVESNVPVEVPILLDSPDQKYEGTWEPGINHPTQPPDKTGPYAGITRYLPIPESQIRR